MVEFRIVVFSVFLIGIISGAAIYGALTLFVFDSQSAYENGYQQGLADGVGTGYNIRDPSYQEMLTFVHTDKTNEHPYINGTYICWQFSADFINNAFNAGYRTGLVYIALAGGAHSIVAFNTTDRGLIFVEPQDDSVVTLQVGTHYFDRSKYVVDYDDTIVSFEIMW